MTSLTLVVARHGNTFEPTDTPVMVGLKTDLPLTEQGQQQAKAIGKDFINRQPKAIYSGQLSRQQQTAQGIQSQFSTNPPLTTCHCLNEIDYGPWEGLPPLEVQKRWPHEHAQWEQGVWQDSLFHEKGENRKEQLQNWLQDINEHYSSGLVLAVTSGGVLKMLASIIEPNKALEKVKTGHYCILQLKQGTVSIKAWNLKPGNEHGWFN